VRDGVYGWAQDRDAAIRTAVALAEQAHRLGPNAPDNIRSLAIARLHEGRHDEAIKLYDQALAAATDDLILLAESTDVLVCAGRAADALARLDRVIAELPDPPSWVHWNRAFALLGLGRLDEAIAAYRALPELNAASAAELAALLATT
jgi:tetratricopeptide (TPR) repeat protein